MNMTWFWDEKLSNDGLEIPYLTDDEPIFPYNIIEYPSITMFPQNQAGYHEETSMSAPSIVTDPGRTIIICVDLFDDVQLKDGLLLSSDPHL